MKTFLNYSEILSSVEVLSPAIPPIKISKTPLSPFSSHLDFEKFLSPLDFVEFKNLAPPLPHKRGGEGGTMSGIQCDKYEYFA